MGRNCSDFLAHIGSALTNHKLAMSNSLRRAQVNYKNKAVQHSDQERTDNELEESKDQQIARLQQEMTEMQQRLKLLEVTLKEKDGEVAVSFR